MQTVTFSKGPINSYYFIMNSRFTKTHPHYGRTRFINTYFHNILIDKFYLTKHQDNIILDLKIR